MNLQLFPQKNTKTYRAIRHDVVRKRQKENAEDAHHPKQKTRQVRQVLENIGGWSDLSVLELFAGQGNLTKVYAQFGEVLAYEKNQKTFVKLRKNVESEMLVACNKGDSYTEFHRLIF